MIDRNYFVEMSVCVWGIQRIGSPFVSDVWDFETTAAFRPLTFCSASERLSDFSPLNCASSNILMLLCVATFGAKNSYTYRDVENSQRWHLSKEASVNFSTPSQLELGRIHHPDGRPTKNNEWLEALVDIEKTTVMKELFRTIVRRLHS